MSVKGDRLIAGYPFSKVQNSFSEGGAYVFKKQGNSWVEDASLNPPSSSTVHHDSDPDHVSVDLDGDFAALGLVFSQSQKVYVFERDTGTGVWGSGTVLNGNDQSFLDGFGSGIDVSGEQVMVGSPYEDSGDFNAGAVYVFKRVSKGFWMNIHKLQSGEKKSFGEFGFILSSSGGSVLVGGSNNAYFFSLENFNSCSHHKSVECGSDICSQGVCQVKPSFRSQFIKDESYFQNLPILETVFPDVTGSITTYSITPALPAGLVFNSSSRVLSGTPTISQIRKSYVYTANTTTGSATLPFSIKILDVDISSTKPDGQYTVGEQISITITYSEKVFVSGNPMLELNVGPGRVASYVSGSGTNTLVFNYVVLQGDSTNDLNYNSVQSLLLNGGIFERWK